MTTTMRDHSMRQTLRSPAEASRFRQTLVAELRSCGFDGAADDAAVMVSELVANALQHAGSPAVVTLEVNDREARVSVHDDSPEHPVLQPLDPGRVGGNGIRVVDAFSTAWGVDAEATGKTVWFTVSRG